jgi:hypothetical protein
MKAKTNRPRLTLEFVGHSTPRLERTKFIRAQEPSESEEPELHECRRGDQFTWREGPKALCLYLLRYRCSALRGGTLETLLHGDESSPLKSLVGAMVKESRWVQDMFGFDRLGNKLLLPQFLKVLKAEYLKQSRTSSRRKGHPQTPTATTFEVEIQSSRFPPESTTILLNGEPVSTPEALENLADAVEDQWYASNPEYTAAWNKIRAERTGRQKAQRRVVTKTRRKSKIKQWRNRPSSGTGASPRSASRTGKRDIRQKDSSAPTTIDNRVLMTEQGRKQAPSKIGGKEQSPSVSAPVEAKPGSAIPQCEPRARVPSGHEVPFPAPVAPPTSPSSPPPGSNASTRVASQICGSGLESYLLLEPFTQVVRILKRAKVERPRKFASYKRALNRDRLYSARMAMRASTPKTANLEYIAFAEQWLPRTHLTCVARYLKRLGPDEFAKLIIGYKDVHAYEFLRRFARVRLPSRYLKAIDKSLHG